MKVRVVSALRRMARALPPLWRVRLRRWWLSVSNVFPPPPTGVPNSATTRRYGDRVREEITRFSVEETVNDLPPIFHYWSNNYLRPLLESFGFSYPEDFVARQIEWQHKQLGRALKVISLGAGNCDSELVVARLLIERGINEFHIDCLDITEAMLERGRRAADAQGLGDYFGFIRADLNYWSSDDTYDVAVANQSLHHVENLEGLFDSIYDAIGEEGIFVTSDMIGRNGHMRWPEALKIVQEFWEELPNEYRFNCQLRRQEAAYGNWDCSVEGFEGIRAQDILPLLIHRFGFDFFLAYGNIIDPFIDRGFGPHFKVENTWDREFIDRVHARDEEELLAGRVSPTHVLAVLRRRREIETVVWRHLTPEFCLRRVEATRGPQDPHDSGG